MESTEAIGKRQPVRVLYVMGAGRSGSTVLNALLGMHPEVEGVGELIHLPKMGWIDNDFCACGTGVNTCPFWAKVKTYWQEATDVKDVEEYVVLLRSQLEGYRRKFTSGFDKIDTTSRQFTRFSELTTALYHAIARASGKPIIVDSSKNPGYAYLLSNIPSIDLRVIHLVRDARGVAWSYAKALRRDREAGVQKELKPIPEWMTALRWTRVNARSEWVKKRMAEGKALRIRYEDILTDPVATLNRIGDLLCIDYNGIDVSKSNLQFSHTVAGNRVRTQRGTMLRLSDEWNEKMPTKARRVTELVAGWPLLKYGYFSFTPDGR